jgi:hypothetical protein
MCASAGDPIILPNLVSTSCSYRSDGLAIMLSMKRGGQGQRVELKYPNAGVAGCIETSPLNRLFSKSGQGNERYASRHQWRNQPAKITTFERLGNAVISLSYSSFRHWVLYKPILFPQPEINIRPPKPIILVNRPRHRSVKLGK